MGNKGVYDLVKVAFENMCELLKGQTDPVVGDPVLGKVVCPDPFTTVT